MLGHTWEPGSTGWCSWEASGCYTTVTWHGLPLGMGLCGGSGSETRRNIRAHSEAGTLQEQRGQKGGHFCRARYLSLPVQPGSPYLQSPAWPNHSEAVFDAELEGSPRVTLQTATVPGNLGLRVLGAPSAHPLRLHLPAEVAIRRASPVVTPACSSALGAPAVSSLCFLGPCLS